MKEKKLIVELYELIRRAEKAEKKDLSKIILDVWSKGYLDGYYEGYDKGYDVAVDRLIKRT